LSDKIATPDVLIVGSGAAALTAALRAKYHNLNPLIIEKTSNVGGTTSYSGGGLWIPNSGIHPPSVSDSFQEALTYMKNTVDVQPTKASTLARKTAFLENGPKMVNFLKDQGFEWQPSIGYPDYYPLVEGGKVGGRSIEGKVFDLKKLDDWQNKIRMTTRKPLYPMYTFEAGDMYRHGSSWKGYFTAAKVVGLRMQWHRMLGRLPVTLGMSLVGQLLFLCKENGVNVSVDTALKKLVVRDGVVRGAIVERGGEQELIEAKKGVILAAGGFARNTSMRQTYQDPMAAAAKTLTSPEDKGDAITAAMKVGSATELMDEAWWGPTLLDKNGKPYWCQFERALPHSVVVDQAGDRFGNEAEAYTRFIHNFFAHQKKTGLHSPAYLIVDSRHRERFVFSGMRPKKTERWALDDGLLVKADTVEELANKLNIDAVRLRSTIERFNTMTAEGVDQDFNRGLSPYDHFFGDPDCTPNPNLGPLVKPPFYAAKLVPGDLGTKGGVLTDEYARALKEDGSVIEGLYAVGNSSASVMGKEYIGAGSTLGPALAFAYIAIDDIAKTTT
jgi:3-oxosteroid 1-dehydrogenase